MKDIAYLRKHETLFSIIEQEMESLSIFDEYELEKAIFRAGGYDVEVKMLYWRSINCMKRKRTVFLLSY